MVLKVKMYILTLVQLGKHLRQQGKIWRNEDQKLNNRQEVTHVDEVTSVDWHYVNTSCE